MSNVKWRLKAVSRPLNEVIFIMLGDEVKGSFTIETTDLEGIILWTKIAHYLQEQQRDDVTDTRIN